VYSADHTHRLWWTDIESRTISSADEHDNGLQQWTLPDRVGSFALCDREGPAIHPKTKWVSSSTLLTH